MAERKEIHVTTPVKTETTQVFDKPPKNQPFGQAHKLTPEQRLQEAIKRAQAKSKK
jgi:hypothetical protein